MTPAAGRGAAPRREDTPPEFASRLVPGKLVHRRFRPVAHRFTYPVSYFLFDLDELPHLDRRLPLFGYNRKSIVSFRDADHLDGRTDLRAEVRRFHEERGAEPPAGRILLLTQPRIFGYVFNPVSFYYCHDEEGHVVTVLAEINNTFGERHTYLLDERTKRDDGPAGIRSRAERTAAAASGLPRPALSVHETPKVIFVSPFARKAGRFRFAFSTIADGLSIHMDDFDAEGRFLDATLSGRIAPLTARSLLENLLRYPFMTLAIITRIHLQAVRLWLRRTPHFPHEPLNTGELR